MNTATPSALPARAAALVPARRCLFTTEQPLSGKGTVIRLVNSGPTDDAAAARALAPFWPLPVDRFSYDHEFLLLGDLGDAIGALTDLGFRVDE